MIETPSMLFKKNFPNWAGHDSFDEACLHFWPCTEVSSSSAAGSYVDVVGGKNIIESIIMGESTHLLNGFLASTNTPALSAVGSNTFLFVAAVVTDGTDGMITYGNVATGQGFEISSAAGNGISYKGVSAELNNNASTAGEMNVGVNIIIGMKSKADSPDSFNCFWGEDGTIGVSDIDISTAGNLSPTAELKLSNITGVYGMAMFSDSILNANITNEEILSFGRALGAYWIAGNKIISGLDYSNQYRTLS